MSIQTTSTAQRGTELASRFSGKSWKKPIGPAAIPFIVALGLIITPLLAPPLAKAISPNTGLQLYLEDFSGETSFPTSPEVDHLELGGLIGGGFDVNFVPQEPTLSGDSVVFAIEPLTGRSEVLGMSFIDLGTNSVGMRAEFSEWSDPDPSTFKALVGLSMRGFDSLGSNQNSYAMGIVVERDSITQEVTIRLRQTIGPIADPEETVLEGEAFSLGTFDLIDTPFILTLEINRSNSTYTGSIEIPGTTSFAPPSEVALIPGSVPIDSVNSFYVNLLPPQSTMPSSIELDTFELYEPFSTEIIVDSALDAADPLLGNGVCGDATSGCTLRAAIQESNARAGAGRITIPDLGAPIVLSLLGADEDAAASGDLDITDTLVIEGTDAATTIIDGNATDRVLHIPNSAKNTLVFLRDLTLRNGFAATATSRAGGAIESWGRLFLDRCVLENNTAGYGGGAINRRWMRMNECLIQNNTAQSLPGGGGGRAGGLSGGGIGEGGEDTETEILNSAIVENNSPVIGGVEFGGAERVLVSNSTLSGNDGRQMIVTNTNDTQLRHATIVNDGGIGFAVGSFGLPVSVSLENTAIQGSPACSLSASPAVNYLYAGNNASNDTTCGFDAAGSFEGQPLTLGPLTMEGESKAHLPLSGSILRDAADPAFCVEAFDQLGSLRPQDSDQDGFADCEIGAIEVPEADAIAMLAAGVTALVAAARRPGAL